MFIDDGNTGWRGGGGREAGYNNHGRPPIVDESGGRNGAFIFMNEFF